MVEQPIRKKKRLGVGAMLATTALLGSAGAQLQAEEVISLTDVYNATLSMAGNGVIESIDGGNINDVANKFNMHNLSRPGKIVSHRDYVYFTSDLRPGEHLGHQNSSEGVIIVADKQSDPELNSLESNEVFQVIRDHCDGPCTTLNIRTNDQIRLLSLDQDYWVMSSGFPQNREINLMDPIGGCTDFCNTFIVTNHSQQAMPDDDITRTAIDPDLAYNHTFYFRYDGMSPKIQESDFPSDFRAIVVKNLPAGVMIAGQATQPKLQAGTNPPSYFQVVDRNAFKSGSLKLKIPKAHYGRVFPFVQIYSGPEGSEPSVHKTFGMNRLHNNSWDDGHPGDVNQLMFAQAGSIDFGGVIDNVSVTAPKRSQIKEKYDAWNHVNPPLIFNDHFGVTWGTDNLDRIYKRKLGERWQRVPGLLKDIDVDGAGNVYGVNASDQVYSRDSNASSWYRHEGAFLSHITVDEQGYVGGVNGNDDLWTRDTDYVWKYSPVPETMASIVMGPNNNIWALAMYAPYNLYKAQMKDRHSSDGWKILSNAAGMKSIQVANDGRLFALGDDNHRYVLKSDDTAQTNSDWRWSQIEGRNYHVPTNSNGAAYYKTVALDIVVPPWIDKAVPNTRIFIENIPNDVRLLDENNVEIPASHMGSTHHHSLIYMNQMNVTGLKLDLSNSTQSEFAIIVRMASQNDPHTYLVSKMVWVDNLELEQTDSFQTRVTMPGSRNDYWIERVGNSIVLTNKNDSNKVRRFLMTDVDLIGFDDHMISSADFSKLVYFAETDGGLTNDQYLLVANVPDGVLVNNAVPMGNGMFIIDGKDMSTDGRISFEYNVQGRHDRSLELDITVVAQTHTAASRSLLDNRARINGYANAVVLADKGVKASFATGKDGVRAEARAYVVVGMIASAGGSYDVDGVQSLGANGQVGLIIGRDLHAQYIATGTENTVGVKLLMHAAVGANGELIVQSKLIPGTGITTKGAVALEMYARVEGNQSIHYGDDQYGLELNADAEAGIMATASAGGSASLAGVGGSVAGGVKAGMGAGIGAGAGAMYDDGEITLGLQGEAALLIGLEVDVSIDIDVNDTIETAKGVASGAISATDAVESGAITLADAVETYGLPVVRAVATGLVSASDAIETFGVDLTNTVVDTGEAAVGAVVEGVEEIISFFSFW